MNITSEKNKQIKVKAEENGKYVEVKNLIGWGGGYLITNGIKENVWIRDSINFDDIYELRLYVSLLAHAVKKLEDEL